MGDKEHKATCIVRKLDTDHNGFMDEDEIKVLISKIVVGYMSLTERT